MARDEKDGDDLDELVFGYLERAEERPELAPRLLDELCAAKPDAADELRRRVALLVGSGLWSPARPGSAGAPERLGDFRLVRRLGVGGMGVVYLAEQVSIGRRVALKLIKHDQLVGDQLGQNGARARFLREAQAIARLDHPGIVQVLTVGEESGLPYIAMEYVAGAPLDELIARLGLRAPQSLSGADVRAAVAELVAASSQSDPLEWNEPFFRGTWVEIVLRIVRDLAEALHHAHQRGVLHRDIKPSNVLVTPSGRVRLLDFGLASLASAGSITRSGAQIGSLPYMSPEQVDGRTQEIGVASDVYGLGVLMYELLTLRPPFPGETYEEVRRKILDGAATPVRALHAAVSADVETVCHKAFDRSAARRYATAAALAREIDNVLSLRPIEARPPSRVHRLVRWSQRRPALATAILLGALLALAGPLGWELQRMRTIDAVRAAYERSERDFQAARRAIGHVLREMASEELEDVPRMQVARLTAIDRALELYRELERDRPEDAELLQEGGELHKSRGDVLTDLGRREEALAEFELAIAYHRRFCALDPAPIHGTYLAAALNGAGKTLNALWRLPEARPCFEESLALILRASEAAPERVDLRQRVLLAQLNFVEWLRMGGDVDRREERLRETLAQADVLARSAPGDAHVAWTLARTCDELSDVAQERGDLAAAHEWGERALAGYEAAHALEPGSRYYRFDVSTGHETLAVVTRLLGRHEDCERHLRAGQAIVDEMLRDFPQSQRYRIQRCRLLGSEGLSRAQRGDPRSALEAFARAEEEWGRVAELSPGPCDFAVDAAQLLNNLAAAQNELREGYARSIAALERATRLLDACPALVRHHAGAGTLESTIAYSLALTHCLAGDPASARPRIEAVESKAGGDAVRLRYAADLWNEYLLCLRRVRPDPTEEGEARRKTLDLLGRAIAAGYAELDELRTTPALDPFRDDPEFVALLDSLEATR